MNKEAKVTLLALVALGAFVYAGAHVGEAMGIMDQGERDSRQARRHRFDREMEEMHQNTIRELKHEDKCRRDLRDLDLEVRRKDRETGYTTPKHELPSRAYRYEPCAYFE
jgi:hypothetical protein